MQDSEVNDYIKRQIQALKGALQDNIWKRFQEGFKGYTVDTFKLAHRITLRDLRNLLVSYGVPVDTPRRGLSYADALQACLEKKLLEEPTLPPEPQPTNRALLNSANQASLQPQYVQLRPQPVQPRPQPTNRAPINSTNQASLQSQYVQPRPQPPNPLGTLEDWMRIGLPVPPSLRPPNTDVYGRPLQQPQYSIQPPFVQPQVQPQSQYQAPYIQPQASQRSVQYDDDDNWSWPSNKQEQQETSKSYEQPNFSYEVNNDDEDDGQSEGEDWDDDDYNDDYSDDDYE
jgi:hypothetical protein